MTKTLKAAALLLCLLGASARAQPALAPPPDTPVDLHALASEVRIRPTDARMITPRFRALMLALRLRGVPPRPSEALELHRIRRMLGDGRLTPAAQAFDQLVVSLAQEPAAPEPDQAVLMAAGGTAAKANDALPGDTPRLLSRPVEAASMERGELRAPAAIPFGPARVAAAPPPASPRPGQGPPWPLIILLAGGVAGAVGAAAFRRPRSGATTAPAEKKPALTDKYAIDRPLASGGMGEVFEGRDLSLGRRVAIKRMRSEIQRDKELRAQFLKEARTVAKLSHPYIVQIHECFESDADVYLIFEYVDGEPLATRLQRDARLPLKECRRIFGYVCPAIDFAHGKHVLHRDLKPGNIMLDKNGIARVMDFGIALESTRTATSPGPALLDASGTLRYMPPEQHFGRSVRASDVYAMGVCLYEMATGHPPFTAETVEQLLDQKRARRFPAATTLVPGLGKDFDVLVSAALAPDPGNRVSSALEFLELLDGVLSKQLNG